MNGSDIHRIPTEFSVISTQPAEQARKLSQSLSDVSIAFFSMPMIRTEAYPLDAAILKTLKNLNSYRWLIFTSKNGVTSFFQLLTEAGLSFPENLKTAVIGNTTESALKKHLKKVDFINPGQTSIEFMAAFTSEILLKDEKVLFVLGNLAPKHMQQELNKIVKTDRLDTYQTLGIAEYNESIMQKIWDNRYDLLVFTSPSAFSNFYKYYQIKKSNIPLRIVSIGPITTQAILKFAPARIITVKEAGLSGLKKEIIHSFKNKKT